MKQSKKLLSLFIVLALSFSLTSGYICKAATENITITLRVENDETTMVTPVSVTLTESDKKDYGIGLSTKILTPLHALAKYFTEKKGATDATMSKYINFSTGWLSGISSSGTCDSGNFGGPASQSQTDVSWMFAVNHASPVDEATGYGQTSDSYSLKNQDNIVFYGVWWGDFANNITSYYTTFDKDTYTAKVGESVSVSLKGVSIYDAGKTAANAVTGASIMAADKNSSEYADSSHCISSYTTLTDASGNASLKFNQAGTYVLSASRKTADGTHFDISRPYALVTVINPQTTETTSQTSPTSPNKTATTDITKKTVKKLSKPTSLKAKIKKTKKAKKTIRLSWKKVSNASYYRIYLSKKKNGTYKKTGTSKTNKFVLKRKKGIYYVKIKAYNKTNSSSFSKKLKIKVRSK